MSEKKTVFKTPEERQQFIKGIYEIFVKMSLIDSQVMDTVKPFFSDEAVDNYWIPAFTDTSALTSDNFETLEWYGDSACDYAFVDYIIKKFGKRINQERGTNMKKYYMSKYYQADIAVKYGMDKLVIKSSKIKELTADLTGDIFESFFGAMVLIGDTYIGPTVGFAFLRKAFEKIFDEENIDVEDDDKYNAATLTLKSIFDKYGWGTDAKYTCDTSNSQTGNMICKVHDPRIVGGFLGEGVGDMKIAKELAARQALKKLAENGITLETANIVQEERRKKDSPKYAEAINLLNSYIDSYNIENKDSKIFGYRFFPSITQEGKGNNITTIALRFIFDDERGTRYYKDVETANFKTSGSLVSLENKASMVFNYLKRIGFEQGNTQPIVQTNTGRRAAMLNKLRK